jgi:hypothetical protein
MRLQVSNSTEFERLLDGLAADVLDAGYHLQLRMALDKAVPEYQREFNQALAFWHLTFNAHNAAAMAHLSRAYDQRPDSLCLLNLLDTIADNLDLFGPPTQGSHPPPVINPKAACADLDQLKRDRLAVSPSDPLVKRLMALRGNAFAHRNAANTIQRLGLQGRFSLSYADLEALWELATVITNRYSKLFRHQTWATSLVGQDDYMSVLSAIRRDIDHQEALIRQELDDLNAGGAAT